MPCWYFSKSELKNTPSFCNFIDTAVEEKYRREGVKLIVDAGTALGLYPIFTLIISFCSFNVDSLIRMVTHSISMPIFAMSSKKLKFLPL